MAKFDRKAQKEIEELRAFEEHRGRLIKFYTENAPNMLGEVDSTLKQWAGREDDLFAALQKKYLGRADAKRMFEEDFQNVVNGLKQIYKSKLRPVEEAYKFDRFFFRHFLRMSISKRSQWCYYSGSTVSARQRSFAT